LARHCQNGEFEFSGDFLRQKLFSYYRPESSSGWKADDLKIGKLLIAVN
jgi:hypothetical protein